MLVMMFVFMPLPEPDISGLHKQEAWHISFEKSTIQFGLYRVVWFQNGNRMGEGTLRFDSATKVYTLNSRYWHGEYGVGKGVRYDCAYIRVGTELVDVRHRVHGYIELQLRK